MSLRPSLNGVLEVAIYVADVPAAVAFYERVLGLSVLEADERLTAMAAGGNILLVCRRGASLSRPTAAHDSNGSQHVAFSVAAADLPAWETHLQSAGVKIEESRAWARGGRSLYFRDPDGHLLELASPGVWSIY
jgi:catechol 2,3-dioxygenase-like lactoylglutathione lyase family enzyme